MYIRLCVGLVVGLPVVISESINLFVLYCRYLCVYVWFVCVVFSAMRVHISVCTCVSVAYMCLMVRVPCVCDMYALWST